MATIDPYNPFDDSSLGRARRAFMDTIASYESPSYNTMYGGTKFSGYADHPRTGHRITSGPNKGKLSSAAGRYQFTKKTWDRMQRTLHLPDFSPASQDAAGYALAQEDFEAATGQSLDDVLSTGDPTQIAAAARSLHGTWTSLPGGIERQASDNGFARRFSRNLAKTDLVPPGEEVASAPLQPVQQTGGLLAALPSNAEKVSPFSQLASALNPISSAQAAEMSPAEQAQSVQVASLDPSTGFDRVVGQDVTPEQNLAARMADTPPTPQPPSMPGQNRMMPDLSARMADNPPAQPNGYVKPQISYDVPSLAREKVSPIGNYGALSPLTPENVSPFSGYDVLSPEKRIRNQPIPAEVVQPIQQPALAPIDQTQTVQPPAQVATTATQKPAQTISPPAATTQPEQQNTFPAAPPAPEESIFGPRMKGALLGALTGGIPGAVMGGLLGGQGIGGLLGGNQGPVSAADRFGVGYGMNGINAAMGGRYGATGYSRSNPGAFVTSRGPNQGYDLTNQYGAITHYDRNGNITATPYSGIGLGGLLGRLSGGLLGGGNGRGFSQKDYDAAAKGTGLF